MKTSRHLKIAVLLLSVYWAFMFHIAFFDPLEISTTIFSENSTIEAVSPYLWFMLAVFCLFSNKLSVPTRLASAVTAVLLGFREMDWHKSFFQEETFRTHFLRSNFYRSDMVPLSHKIIGGLLVLLIIIVAVYLLKTFVRSVRREGKPFQTAYIYTASGIFLLAVAKFADRLNGQMIEFFQKTLPPKINIAVQAFEESTEMIVPVLLCIALILYSNRQHDGT
ncbi:hypothetical protein [Neisseria sp. CCUG12390]|uniref:hypothetical protein n=1 Tax=Neisseria sp. CCUG12390 TaxID=3392035 RepID=UPI003A0FEFCD